MDIQKEREAFQKFCEENFDFERHEQTYFDEQTQCYENDIGEDTESINMAWSAWQAAKAQAVPAWNSVGDSLPPVDETVLVCWDYAADIEPEKEYLTLDEDYNEYWPNCQDEPPTHWLPLPKVIKAQEKAND